MNDIDKALIMILIICAIFILFYVVNDASADSIEIDQNVEHMDSKLKWTRSTNCRDHMNDPTYDALHKNNISFVDENRASEADIVFPCGYNAIDHEIRSLPHVGKQHNAEKPKIAFIIDGADEITAKNFMWRNIRAHHGLEKAKIIAPNTYLLVGDDKTADMARLKKEHVIGRLYMMKNNQQRQMGLQIVDDISNIEKINGGNHVLIQELLTDPYLVNSYKINLRVYVVVVSHKSNTSVYVYDDGFVYYSKKKYDPNDRSPDNHITTGYVDREVYEINPLTLTDFKKHLDLKEGTKYHDKAEPRHLNDAERKIDGPISIAVFERIDRLLEEIFKSFQSKICRKAYANGVDIPIHDDITMQIFGADIALSKDLVPQIMEINKGPDLKPKDDRDAKIKKALMNSAFELAGLAETQGVEGDAKLRHILHMKTG